MALKFLESKVAPGKGKDNDSPVPSAKVKAVDIKCTWVKGGIDTF